MIYFKWTKRENNVKTTVYEKFQLDQNSMVKVLQTVHFEGIVRDGTEKVFIWMPLETV